MNISELFENFWKHSYRDITFWSDGLMIDDNDFPACNHLHRTAYFELSYTAVEIRRNDINTNFCQWTLDNIWKLILWYPIF